MSSEEYMMNKHVILIIVFLVMLFFIFGQTGKSKPVVSIREFLYSCQYKCANKYVCEVVDAMRGENYGFDPNKEDLGENTNKLKYKQCLITGWEVSHFLFHVFLGYYYDACISLSVNVVFELFEHYFYDCGSYNDLLINFLGFCVGKKMSMGIIIP